MDSIDVSAQRVVGYKSGRTYVAAILLERGVSIDVSVEDTL